MQRFACGFAAALMWLAWLAWPGLPAAAVDHARAVSAHAAQRLAASPSGASAALDRRATVDTKPWVEGVDPKFEDELFWTTYRILPEHNVLKVYAIDANGYEAAGVRFSARVPHEQRDLSAREIDREAVKIIRATFDDFPQVQTVDVWGTIPVEPALRHSMDETVFSISADRSIYDEIRAAHVGDRAFLSAFGHVWVAPQVPQ